MKSKKVIVHSGNKDVRINVKLMNSVGGKIKGLMFEGYNKTNPVIFEFKKNVKKPLHTFFCFFPILMLWLGKDGKLLDYQAVKSWKTFVIPKGKFSSIIEIPLTNSEYLKFRVRGKTNLSTVINKIKKLKKVKY